MPPPPSPAGERRGRRWFRWFPPLRRTYAQIDAYARYWREANERVLKDPPDGQRWVVCGDSAAQGVGASAPDLAWVGRALTRLDEDRRPGSPPWHVVNLSKSGARIRDVLDGQLPRAVSLQPDLLTVVIGANDLTHSSEPEIINDINDLCLSLPAGSVIATLPRGWREPKARAANEVLERMALQRHLIVADLWARTGPPYAGLFSDGFHPNDAGYANWTEAIAAAHAVALAGGAPDPDSE